MPKKGTALSIHSFMINSQMPLKKVLVEQYGEYIDHAEPLKKLFDDYARHQKELGIADFDSLLVLMRDLLHHEHVGPMIRRRFDSVLVDEYQDTNPLQAQVLQALCPTGEGLTGWAMMRSPFTPFELQRFVISLIFPPSSGRASAEAATKLS